MTPVVPQEEPFAVYERLIKIETLLISYNASTVDHETRIRKLERNIWIAILMAGVGGGGIGQFLATLVK